MVADINVTDHHFSFVRDEVTLLKDLQDRINLTDKVEIEGTFEEPIRKKVVVMNPDNEIKEY